MRTRFAAVEQAIAAGHIGIEHCTCVGPNGLDFSADLMARLREENIVVCPTLGKALDAVLQPRILEMLARFGMTLESRPRCVRGSACRRCPPHLRRRRGDQPGQAPRCVS